MEGRKTVFKELEKNKLNNVIWFHCASLGEFEQAMPVIDAVKNHFPGNEIVVTFFSSSGYEVIKDKGYLTHIFYLPHDSASNALRFIRTLNPAMAIFVKYEFWYYYLSTLKQSKVPVILLSAVFRENDVFFRWYGEIFREMLRYFSHIFVQDSRSASLLESIDVKNVTVTGDTRFDRVNEIRETHVLLPLVEKFTQDSRIFIAGSTWPWDEEYMVRLIKEDHGETQIKFIIAPHELKGEQIKKIIQSLEPFAIAYSQANVGNIEQYRVLVIDNIGMLAHLYKYADIAYVGGGFNAGIHNILEAAAYGLPVIFGPKYQKFNEAIELINLKGAFPIKGYEGLKAIYEEFKKESNSYKQAAIVAGSYVTSKTGATERIMKYIDAQIKSLVTNQSPR